MMGTFGMSKGPRGMTSILFIYLFCNEVVYPTDYDCIDFSIFRFLKYF